MRRLFAALLTLWVGASSADDAPVWAPFITTPDIVVERMLTLAGTGPDDLVMDLGSGDGRIVIAAAQKFGARGVGIELDASLIERSRRNARLAKVSDRVSFVRGNVLTADLSQASVVTLYLLPSLIGELEPRLLHELAPGTRIVAHAFGMSGWKPDRVKTLRLSQRHPGQGEQSTLYLWVVPAKVRGVWSDGTRRWRISQNYQQIEVEGALSASLSGRSIGWKATDASFRGRVAGERIVGELVFPDGSRAPLGLTRESKP